MSATHIVLKPFEVKDGERLKAGTEVDASEWRNTDKLVAHRYLKALPSPSVAAPMPQIQSRQLGGEPNRHQQRGK